METAQPGGPIITRLGTILTSTTVHYHKSYLVEHSFAADDTIGISMPFLSGSFIGAYTAQEIGEPRPSRKGIPDPRTEGHNTPPRAPNEFLAGGQIKK